LKKLNPSAQLEAFLSACKISSEEAVSELSKLVNALENPQSQKSAAQLLKSLVYFISDKPEATIKK
jgi:hypothetical protein